jgi:hypothetical protein
LGRSALFYRDRAFFLSSGLGGQPAWTKRMTRETKLSLKTRLLAGASCLTLAAGGMLIVAAPAAHAAPTPIGGCGGQILLGTITPALGDQTQIGVVIKTKILKDLTAKTAIGGACATAVRPGDPIQPAGGSTGTLTPKAEAASLTGNLGCAQGPTAVAADATAAAQWPASGKITITMTQLNALAKPYQIQAATTILGFNPGFQDVVDLGGVVLKGAAFGATVSGSIWEDPVSKTGGPTGYNTGYELDISNALGCADGTPNNATISTVLSGGGNGASFGGTGTNGEDTSTSLLGSTGVPGLGFSLGE